MEAKVSKKSKAKKRPLLFPIYCKGCERCIEACPQDCILAGTDINSTTGLVPVNLHLENCTSCSLCVRACPEPYALGMVDPDQEIDPETADPIEAFQEELSVKSEPHFIPTEEIPLDTSRPLVIKGNHAASVGAILAGCRHFYGYPITPSTEGAELMAKFLPQIHGTFYQAVSEVAAVNMMYGTGGAGLPCMTFTSSPGFSLMLEGISYMIGSEVPSVFVNVMRGGPGLGNIAPEQSDIKLCCRGLGHGHTHGLVFAPSTPQEMLDISFKAFELSFKYRNPVIIVADGYLGQMTGKVELPSLMKRPGIPEWAVYGDKDHKDNLICSISLSEHDQEKHCQHLENKYQQMRDHEALSETYLTDDAEILLVACNTPARMAKGATSALREKGIKVGLFRPITLWPFPIKSLKENLRNIKRVVVVEASQGQLEDEMRLVCSQNDVPLPPISHVRRLGGVLPQQEEVVNKVLSLKEVQ